MPFITELGSGTFFFVIAVVMLILKKDRFRTSAILLLAGITSAHYTVRILKNLIERPRPFIMLTGVNTLYTIGGFSFPSGHACMAFMAAAILSKCLKKGYIFYSAAVIVALSRIYLGFHFMSDVIAGGIIGIIIGFLILYTAESVWGPEIWSRDN